MARWTYPRIIAYRNKWYDDSSDYDGPACYEIGTGGLRAGNLQWHYVGETKNELTRIAAYARTGSHLSDIIEWHLRRGWCLYCRSVACSSKREAKQMQDNLLFRYKYDWNEQLNRD
jgi:hypothetical protein